MNIEGPVVDFAEFAIADDIDTGLGLLPHDLGDGIAQRIVVGSGWQSFLVLDRPQHVDEFLGTDQAADMRGQDAICHAFPRFEQQRLRRIETLWKDLARHAQSRQPILFGPSALRVVASRTALS